MTQVSQPRYPLHVCSYVLTCSAVRSLYRYQYINIIAEMADQSLNKTEMCDSTNNENKIMTKVEDGEDYIDPIMYKDLTSMGMDKNLTRKALKSTKNVSVDAALKWIAELGAEEMEALCKDSEELSNSSKASSEYTDCEDDDDEEIYYKMVFIVNTEHGMGMGKVASQVGHAAIGLYKLLQEDKEKYENSLAEWELTGEKKITLKGHNTLHLLDLQKDAEKNDLPTYLVEDAGRTQISSGSITVLGIFGDEDAVNEVTGKLRLL